VSTTEGPATEQTRPELLTFGHERPVPGTYYLDLRAAGEFPPLKYNGQPSTFIESYRKLRDLKILKLSEKSPWGKEETFETDQGLVTITTDSYEPFVLNVICELIDLHRNGIDPDLATWFYYGHDLSCDGDPMYCFFLVYNGKIAHESFSFIHRDPRMLVKVKADKEPIWRSEPYRQEAWETYWYRRFYTETLTGQLMVLRPDEPILYRYDRAVHDTTGDVELLTLIKIYRLLWIAVPLLGAIAFPRLWPYMAVVAAAAAADLLWKCWATRKIGR
jgi:hypothetical protein